MLGYLLARGFTSWVVSGPAPRGWCHALYATFEARITWCTRLPVTSSLAVQIGGLCQQGRRDYYGPSVFGASIGFEPDGPYGDYDHVAQAVDVDIALT